MGSWLQPRGAEVMGSRPQPRGALLLPRAAGSRVMGRLPALWAARAAHLALLCVGQHLVLLPGVEDERLHGEGDKLLLEGGALVRAEEQALVPVAERGAHEDDLKDTDQEMRLHSGEPLPAAGSPQPPEATGPGDT